MEWNKHPQLTEENIKERKDLADEIFALIEGKKNINILPTLIGVYTLVVWQSGKDKKFALRTAADYIDEWYSHPLNGGDK